MTATVKPATATVQLRGLTFRYLDWGNADALPLLLLHGLGGAAGDWTRVAEHFRSRYHVIALDQRGHGETDHAPDRAYATDDFVADLEAFVEALGLQRLMLLGHSMGGHNTIAFTARHPERVVCALANDIPPRFERGDPSARTAAFPGGEQPVFVSIAEWIESRREGSPYTPEEMHRLLAESRLKRVNAGFQPRSDANAHIHWAPADLWDEARAITRPIFFIRGGKSNVLDAETLQEMDMRIEPARSITLEQSGHNTFLDMEEEFLATATEFFAAHGG